ncbi:general substrate transporter [Coccomyxa subellipsoidea C-169]|uniref:General substrate transporter n=1 Tax=Coccomyxa subellipsoidea (strain C-169) TaxID=574566 RepID=I0Z695_COCSC|nr:general substrate transporter [Coccomyxa subellipsoidea C-169]EIE26164.1 general substrate transporter [Coccomyxa subellipsoidea C-169]|eukprot:XP_005650708.1 general substrate transporter [Coccomyxa subellipsoidea C-169]
MGVIDVEAKSTIYVVLACFIAASGGLLFGYDGGCTGGVESMKQFAQMWFPSTADVQDTDFYCKFNDKPLQAYSSVMHFTGAIASLPASYVTQHFGRTMSMKVAGTAYILGSILQAAASRTIAMLFIGRILWGIGVGFGDHCAFIYTSEMAPPRWRGRLNTLVQCGTITGIVIASAINIGTSRVVWGWRISLGLAAVPGSILLLGGIFLPDTPNSLVERGHIERGRAVLRRVRGTRDVDVEFSSILIANKATQHTENPWRSIGRRRNRPQLVLAIAMPFLQQWSGVNAVSFFAPQIFAGVSAFKTSGIEGPLYAALLVNGVQWIATIVTVICVDKARPLTASVGRRSLLISGSLLGLAADFAVAIVFALSYSGGPYLPTGASIAAIVLISLYSISFGFSWGPIGWLIPSEVHDLHTRSAGQSITVFTQLLSGAIVTQVFLMMMCNLKWGVFVFFGLWQTVALVFTVLLVPETRGVPIEKARSLLRYFSLEPCASASKF